MFYLVALMLFCGFDSAIDTNSTDGVKVGHILVFHSLHAADVMKWIITQTLDDECLFNIKEIEVNEEKSEIE